MVATTEIVAVAALDAAEGSPTAAPILLAVTVLPRQWRGRR
jgi:hypothetical protein